MITIYGSSVAAVGTTEDGAEWLVRIRSDDHEAFRALFNAYYAELRDYAIRHVGTADVAEEIVQEVFFMLWTHRATLGAVRSVRGYLYGAVHHRIQNERRHDRRIRRWTAAFAREAHGVGTGTRPARADAAICASELSAVVQRAIDALPERCRLVYTFRIGHGLTHAEIAEALGISVKTVEAQITKAMTVLRRAIERVS
jgi:RNA polymerase sigma-70 factor (ECF subfamily)